MPRADAKSKRKLLLEVNNTEGEVFGQQKQLVAES